jgi:hypothetical protein
MMIEFEIEEMTRMPDFTKEQQKQFFNYLNINTLNITENISHINK